MPHRLIQFRKLADTIEEYTRQYTPTTGFSVRLPRVRSIASQNLAIAIRNLLLGSSWISRYQWHQQSPFASSRINLKEMLVAYLISICIDRGTMDYSRPYIMNYEFLWSWVDRPDALWDALKTGNLLRDESDLICDADSVLRWEATYQLGLELMKRLDKNNVPLRAIIIKKVKSLLHTKDVSPYIFEGRIQHYDAISDEEWNTAIETAWAVVCRCYMGLKQSLQGSPSNWEWISTRLAALLSGSFSVLQSKVIAEIVVKAWSNSIECVGEGMVLNSCRKLWSESPLGALYLVCNILSKMAGRLYFTAQKSFVPFPDLAFWRPVEGGEITLYRDTWPESVDFPAIPFEPNERRVLQVFLGPTYFDLEKADVPCQVRDHHEDIESDGEGKYLKGVLSVIREYGSEVSYGTAFVVWFRYRYFIVTCAHVLQKLPQKPALNDYVFFRTTTNARVKGKLVIFNPPEKDPKDYSAKEDIAVCEMICENISEIVALEMRTSGLQELKGGSFFGFRSSSLRLGDWIKEISSVGGLALGFYKITCKTDVKDAKGFSGSPLIDNNWAVLGVVRAGYLREGYHVIPCEIIQKALSEYFNKEV